MNTKIATLTIKLTPDAFDTLITTFQTGNLHSHSLVEFAGKVNLKAKRTVMLAGYNTLDIHDRYTLDVLESQCATAIESKR